ncbi:MAG: transglycosylase SLT domain-containing protein, partial [bacterium]
MTLKGGNFLYWSGTIVFFIVSCGRWAISPNSNLPPSANTPSTPPETLREKTSSIRDSLWDSGLSRDLLPSEWSDLSTSERLALSETLLDSAQTLIKQNPDAAEIALNQARALLATLFLDSIKAEYPLYLRLVSRSASLVEELIKFKWELSPESSFEEVMSVLEGGEDSLLSDSAISWEEALIDTTDLYQIISRKEPLPPVPLMTNAQVERALLFFQTRGRKVFQRWLDRAGTYELPLREILRQEGLPEELVYVAMIESGFNVKAYSYAHASGLWQFIASTARIFGLEVSWWYDERRDIVKSTYAACRYLRKLYYDFGDWYLALAAYNCGEKKVAAHIARYRTTDFWKLTRLPRQTRNYVPTYLAARIIAEDPKAFGFEPPLHSPMPPCDSVWVKEQTDLRLAAQLAGISYDQLRELNPTLLRWATPPHKDSCLILLPQGKGEGFLEDLAKVPPSEKRVYTYHRVRQGETLSTIARRYGVSVKDILAVAENRIVNIHRLKVGQELVIPVPPHVQPRSSEVAAKSPSTSPGLASSAGSPKGERRTGITQGAKAGDEGRRTTHRVAPGETLFSIGKRFG